MSMFEDALREMWWDGWQAHKKSRSLDIVRLAQYLTQYPILAAAPETAAERDRLKKSNEKLLTACKEGLELAQMLNHPYELKIEDAIAEAEAKKE